MINWLNLPPASYDEIFQSPKSNYVVAFQDEIWRYHEAETIQDKIEKIHSLLGLIEVWSVEENNTLFPLVQTQLQAKLEYWEALYSALQVDWISYHLAPEVKTEYVPLRMRNNLTYSLKMGEFWGAFWLESIDPCHRRLAPYYKRFIDANGQIGDWSAFFLWLEKELVPKNIPVVKYLSNEEAQKCRVEFEAGLCIDPTSKTPITIAAKNKQPLFVISLEKELFISQEGDGIWHSSFTQGKPVLAAGRIEIDKGVITTLGFDSGHYFPQAESFFQFIQLFKEIKATFINPIRIIFYENRNKYSASIPVEFLEDESLFKDMLARNKRIISTCEF